jgi:hypothetical protein
VLGILAAEIHPCWGFWQALEGLMMDSPAIFQAAPALIHPCHCSDCSVAEGGWDAAAHHEFLHML